MDGKFNEMLKIIYSLANLLVGHDNLGKFLGSAVVICFPPDFTPGAAQDGLINNAFYLYKVRINPVVLTIYLTWTRRTMLSELFQKSYILKKGK